MERLSSERDSFESWKKDKEGAVCSPYFSGMFLLELILHYKGNPTESEKKSEHSQTGPERTDLPTLKYQAKCCHHKCKSNSTV